jgi:hypothetical protein
MEHKHGRNNHVKNKKTLGMRTTARNGTRHKCRSEEELDGTERDFHQNRRTGDQPTGLRVSNTWLSLLKGRKQYFDYKLSILSAPAQDT